jgi:hypothetical protein
MTLLVLPVGIGRHIGTDVVKSDIVKSEIVKNC